MELIRGRRLSWIRLALALLVIVALIFASLRGWRWFEDTRVEVRGDSWFAGYADVTAVPSYEFEEPSDDSGNNAVLSFVVAAGPTQCTPTWGTYATLAQAADQFDLDRRIARLHQLGGVPMVSFGGQANTELAIACADVDDLLAAYREVVERYDLQAIDLDIEGAALVDAVSNQRRAEAMARLQELTDVEVWLTLPVTPAGLTADGLDIVDVTVGAGVELAGVNLMTMNYGESRDEEQSMGDAATSALQSTHEQLARLYEDRGQRRTDAQLWRGLGATPMLGQNDLAGEVFTLADAERLKEFADRRRIGRLSLWSLNRDRECSSNWPDVTRVSDSCSGVDQESGDFARILGLGARGEPVRAEDASESPQTDPTASVTDDPESSPYAIWEPDQIYLEDQRVVWKQNVYVAKWWTSDDVPDDPTIEASASAWRLVGPVLPGETPRPNPTVPADTLPRWDPETVYRAGDRVQLGERAYVALWWNQSVSPQTPSTQSAPTPWRALTRAEVRRLPGGPAQDP